MWTLIFWVLDLVFSIFGFICFLTILYLAYKFRTKMLWSEEHSLFGYKIELEAAKKESLKIEIKKE